MASTGDGISAENANWSFGGDVPDNFDQHVQKSVPMYAYGHDLIIKLSDFFVEKDSNIYDIGCSTGTLLNILAEHHIKKNINIYGCDTEKEMVSFAKQNCSKHKNINILNCSALEVDFQDTGFISSFYTVQFIHPSVRQDLINKIYNSLKWGGAFLMFEKVRACDARFQDICTTLYNDYKFDQGYSANEIYSKTKSLKGVLEPFSSQGNIDMLTRAGFKDTISVFKYLSFEGFLAIK